MQKLSVAIITLDEEANIVACIESVNLVADEIIIIDSGSTDKTVEIAESLGAKVIHHTFEGYAEQKNVAIAECSYPYILSLDADERLDKDLQIEIVQQKENDFPHDGYILRRSSFIGDRNIKHGTWGSDKKLRLIKKELGKWQGKGVHESLMISSTNLLTLHGNILHYSYKNTDELFEKTKKYASLAAQYLHQQNKTISPIMIPVKALARFIKHYFLKMGILDGAYGWQIGKQQYFEALWKYRELKRLNNR